MSIQNKLTISYLLVYLRKTLENARSEKDAKLLSELGTAFDLIEAAAHELDDRKHAAIAEEMRNAVRDILMGTTWKSNIPSIDEINDASS